MLLTIIVVGGIGYAAYRTRPSRASFEKYYQGLHGRRSKLSGLMDRLLGGGSTGVSFDFADWIVVWLVTVRETHELFLGLFGVWISLGQTPFPASREESDNQMGRSGRGERSSPDAALLKAAHAKKAAGNYEEAAALYERAARQATADDGGELLEDAARCHRMAGNDAAYVRRCEEATTAFLRTNRTLRAAILQERLGRHLASQGPAETVNAIKHLERAQELFALEEDGRAKSLQLDILHMYADLGEYERAAIGFIEEAKRIYHQDPILVNQSVRALLWGLFCLLLTRDQVRFNQTLGTLQTEYGWFTNSRESKWIALLGELFDSQGSEEEGELLVERLQRQLDMMASMPSWFTKAWVALKEAFWSAPVDLT